MFKVADLTRLHPHHSGHRTGPCQLLLGSQTEYLAARRRSGALPDSVVLSSARTRLEVLGLSPRDIERLERSGSPQRLTTLVSPRGRCGRAARVRFALDNGDGALRPGIHGTATFAGVARMLPTLPRDAIVDTGDSRHVF